MPRGGQHRVRSLRGIASFLAALGMLQDLQMFCRSKILRSKDQRRIPEVDTDNSLSNHPKSGKADNGGLAPVRPRDSRGWWPGIHGTRAQEFSGAPFVGIATEAGLAPGRVGVFGTVEPHCLAGVSFAELSAWTVCLGVIGI